VAAGGAATAAEWARLEAAEKRKDISPADATKLAALRAGVAASSAARVAAAAAARSGKGPSGIRGVTWDTSTGAWMVMIACMGTTVGKRGFGVDDFDKEAAGRVAAIVFEVIDAAKAAHKAPHEVIAAARAAAKTAAPLEIAKAAAERAAARAAVKAAEAAKL